MQAIVHYPKVRIGKLSVDIFPYWIAFLLGLIAFGLVGAYVVLTEGLYVTGLSNKVPWALWITIDLSAIALGGSAFVFGVIVHLLGLKRFEVVGKLAILLGFLGYSTAGMVLLFDLGQPFRFWHPVVYWQPHSLLWEITMCVVLYLTVLMAELLPIVMEHPGISDNFLTRRFAVFCKIRTALIWLAHKLHSFSPVLAVIGLTLSLLHQASLGATYSVLSGRGLWFNQSAPVQFVLSAVAGGVALLFFLSIVVFRIMRPGLVKDDVFYDLARISGAATLLLTYLRVWDWAVTNYYSFDREIALQTQLLDTIAPYSLTFWLGQALLPAVAGGFLLAAGRVRNFRFLLVMAAIPIFNAILMRWNYNFSGLIASITYDPFTPTVVLNSYTPTWVEFAIAGMVLSYWLLMFSLAARYLPFQSPEKEHSVH
ncbi:MAG: polysulfide reductase NrfD [Anaerolineales bacterium]|nr:polysulfide reductase NrfD [Anaerolineales bacterium]